MSSLRHAALRALLGLTLVATPMAGRAESATNTRFRAELGLRYGPIHHQEVHTRGSHALGGAADFIAAFDFDGDHDASNNWDNAGDSRFPLAAHAYFSVVETPSHWFITYLFFHPRDWSSTFFETEHENDAEGVLLTVARDGTRFGALRAAVSVVHSDFYSFVPDGSPYRSGREDVDGELSLMPFAGELHPVTAQQAETHALKAWPYYRIRDTGVVYYPSLVRAEVPSGPNDRSVSYQLHDMLEARGLWASRSERSLFARPGVFAGNRSGRCGQSALWCVRDAARASWGWDDHDDRSPAGALAAGPAGLIRAYFTTGEHVSTAYSFNPFRQYGVPSW
jgi:hypothetical protein